MSKCISPKELRIGNYLHGEYRVVRISEEKVTVEKNHELIGLNGQYLFPLELTPELLLRLGFNYVSEENIWEELLISYIDGDCAYWIEGLFYLSLNGDWWTLCQATDQDVTWTLHHNVEYVHQLQNILFDLDTKELILKPHE